MDDRGGACDTFVGAWNIAAAKFPEAAQIVDLYHAREHVNDLAGRGVMACR
ncbi:MAG TPA: hypothetical protein VKU77_33265 [Streptosporangiaceae bacterium]|nr:hypothetical protein [Streptosporangiaceae bacterium]